MGAAFLTRASIEERLESFVFAELLDEPFEGPDPLAAEAIDSLGLEQLVEYVEEDFGVRLDDDELIAENFASLPVLASLVHSKLAGSAE